MKHIKYIKIAILALLEVLTELYTASKKKDSK